MPAKKLIDLLEKNNIKYTLLKHKSAFTAQEIAAAAHVPGSELAKAVMVKIDGKMAMAVLPASHQVNFEHLKESTGASKVELATEQEFKDKFPDCEIGALPPFGNLYGIDVLLAESITGQVEIAFCAGSHTELIRMSFKDFKKLAKPTILNFSSKV
jgi:Ala-tRNA(Pro) deacylase